MLIMLPPLLKYDKMMWKWWQKWDENWWLYDKIDDDVLMTYFLFYSIMMLEMMMMLYDNVSKWCVKMMWKWVKIDDVCNSVLRGRGG